MMFADTLTASLEDYLEAIFQIIAEKEGVRPKDIAKRLKVSNASVTGALRALGEKELIHYTPYDVITLTQGGKTLAKDVIRRHEVLRDFFVKVLALKEAVADDAACKMEHSIPKVILERFIQFVEFLDTCPRAGTKWIAGFAYQCDHGGTQERCEACVALCLEEVQKKKTKGGLKTMQTVKLKDLQPGQKCKVLKVKARGETNKRILEMGVIPGAVIELERIAPLGDPIDVKVKGYHLSLRKEEAQGIEVELV